MNWPRIIGSVTAIELLTRGRVRVGTRVRLIRIMYGRQMTEELEVETFERPRGLRLVETERGPGPLKNFITPFMQTQLARRTGARPPRSGHRSIGFQIVWNERALNQ
jgi:hypothetical protein